MPQLSRNDNQQVKPIPKWVIFFFIMFGILFLFGMIMTVVKYVLVGKALVSGQGDAAAHLLFSNNNVPRGHSGITFNF
jgi:hypothetical protein